LNPCSNLIAGEKSQLPRHNVDCIVDVMLQSYDATWKVKKNDRLHVVKMLDKVTD